MNNMTNSSTNAGRMCLRDMCMCTQSKTFPLLLRVTESGLILAMGSYLFDKWRHTCFVKSPPTGLDMCLKHHFTFPAPVFFILTLITL